MLFLLLLLLLLFPSLPFPPEKELYPFTRRDVDVKFDKKFRKKLNWLRVLNSRFFFFSFIPVSRCTLIKDIKFFSKKKKKEKRKKRKLCAVSPRCNVNHVHCSWIEKQRERERERYDTMLTLEVSLLSPGGCYDSGDCDCENGKILDSAIKNY